MSIKRKIVIIVIICTVLSLSSCKAVSKNSWAESDFSFYDSNGKEKYYCTNDENNIYLSKANEHFGYELQTDRGLMIGDRATNLLSTYDLSDFEYNICDFTYLNWNTDKSKKANSKYHEKYETFSEVFNVIDEVASVELDIYAYCDIYEVDENLYTISELKSTDEKYLNDHYKYSVSFRIDGEKIKDVNFEMKRKFNFLYETD